MNLWANVIKSEENWPRKPKNLPLIDDKFIETRFNVLDTSKSRVICVDANRFSCSTRLERAQAKVPRVMRWRKI